MALPNAIVTPHMAFYTAEDVEGMVRSNVEALLAFAAGGRHALRGALGGRAVFAKNPGDWAEPLMPGTGQGTIRCAN